MAGRRCVASYLEASVTRVAQIDAHIPCRPRRSLCHIYARATKVVSRPAPVYYAHLAAYQANYYDPGYKEEGGDWDKASVTSGSDSSGEVIEVHASMKGKLYYC